MTVQPAGVFVGDPSPPLGSSERDGCDRTTGAYPNLVAAGLAADPPAGRSVQPTDVSCDGATIAEIASGGQTPISPVEAPEDGWPGVASQVERAQLSADTDVVTIGVTCTPRQATQIPQPRSKPPSGRR